MAPRSKASASGSRSKAAKKAWATMRSATYRARRTEAKSKVALKAWCQENNWKLVFFEGKTGAPRTGIVDAVMIRIRPRQADAIEIRLVQLKAGVGGLTGAEITRLKAAAKSAAVSWLLAACDGDVLHMVPEIPGVGADTKNG